MPHRPHHFPPLPLGPSHDLCSHQPRVVLPLSEVSFPHALETGTFEHPQHWFRPPCFHSIMCFSLLYRRPPSHVSPRYLLVSLPLLALPCRTLFSPQSHSTPFHPRLRAPYPHAVCRSPSPHIISFVIFATVLLSGACTDTQDRPFHHPVFAHSTSCTPSATIYFSDSPSLLATLIGRYRATLI